MLDNEVKFSFSGGLSFPLLLICRHFKGFCYLTGGVSFLTTVVSMLLGTNIYCSLSSFEMAGLFCSRSFPLLMCFYAFIWLACAVYINRWDMLSNENVSFMEAVKTKCVKRDLKALLVVGLYMLFWILIAVTAIVLYERRPVADWHNEVGFFMFNSSIMLVSTVFLLNFVVFVRFLHGGGFCEIRKTFWPMFDNLYKIFCWFLIYLVIYLYLLRDVFSLLSRNTVLPMELTAFLTEFFFHFITYSVAAVLFSSFVYIENQLFIKEE